MRYRKMATYRNFSVVDDVNATGKTGGGCCRGVLDKAAIEGVHTSIWGSEADMGRKDARGTVFQLVVFNNVACCLNVKKIGWLVFTRVYQGVVANGVSLAEDKLHKGCLTGADGVADDLS